jgi:hypothetical protein
MGEQMGLSLSVDIHLNVLNNSYDRSVKMGA